MRHYQENVIGYAMDELSEEMGWCIATFNDRKSHAEVLASWDRAIANTAP